MDGSFGVSAPEVRTPQVGIGFGPRAGARVIDLILHNLLSLIVGLVAGIFIGLYAAITQTPFEQFVPKLEASSWLDVLLALLGFTLYHTISEGLAGASLGKRILGLHVVQENGTPASFIATFVRSLAFNIDSLFFGLIGSSRMRRSALQQRYGDEWAKTVVIARAANSQYSWPSGWIFTLGLLLAIIADAGIVLLSVLLKLI